MTRNLIRFLAFLTGFALVALLGLAWIANASPDGRIAPWEYRQALRYHGILAAEYRGEWGFYRKGKWCPLFRSMREGK